MIPAPLGAGGKPGLPPPLSVSHPEETAAAGAALEQLAAGAGIAPPAPEPAPTPDFGIDTGMDVRPHSGVDLPTGEPVNLYGEKPTKGSNLAADVVRGVTAPGSLLDRMSRLFGTTFHLADWDMADRPLKEQLSLAYQRAGDAGIHRILKEAAANGNEFAQKVVFGAPSGPIGGGLEAAGHVLPDLPIFGAAGAATGAALPMTARAAPTIETMGSMALPTAVAASGEAAVGEKTPLQALGEIAHSAATGAVLHGGASAGRGLVDAAGAEAAAASPTIANALGSPLGQTAARVASGVAGGTAGMTALEAAGGRIPSAADVAANIVTAGALEGAGGRDLVKGYRTARDVKAVEDVVKSIGGIPPPLDERRQADQGPPEGRSERRAGISLTPAEAEARVAEMAAAHRASLTDVEKANIADPTWRMADDQKAALEAAARQYDREHGAQPAVGSQEAVVPEHAQPTSPAGPRWTADRGSVPGEPIMTLDGDAQTGKAAIVEVPDQRGNLLYEAVKEGGGSLGTFQTVDEAARAAEAAFPEATAPLKPPPPVDGTETPQPGVAVSFPTKDIAVDPVRFQFRQIFSRKGTSGRQGDVKRYNPELAGVLALWRDPADGKAYVVNGHHRHALAERSGVARQNAFFIDATSAEEARAVGALINIAEGNATAVDAAKFMRDTGRSLPDIQSFGVSPSSALARDADALSKLAKPLFGAVVSGDVPEKWGVAIGSKITDHDLQAKLVKVLDGYQKKGRKIDADTVAELADSVAAAPTETETTTDLFGSSQKTQSFALEKAQVSAEIRRRLSTEKRLFKTVGKKGAAEALARGGNVIDEAASAKIGAEAGQTLGVYDLLKNQVGPIADALNAAAVDVGKGTDAKKAADEAYARILPTLSEALGRGGGKGDRAGGAVPEVGAAPASTGRAAGGPRESPGASGAEGARAEDSQLGPGPAGAAKAEPKLPQALAGAKPRYSYQDKQFDLAFSSDVDRAAYITAQAKRSKQDAGYLDFAMRATGLSEPEVRAYGAEVRSRIKEMARAADPAEGPLKVPAGGAPKAAEPTRLGPPPPPPLPAGATEEEAAAHAKAVEAQWRPQPGESPDAKVGEEPIPEAPPTRRQRGKGKAQSETGGDMTLYGGVPFVGPFVEQDVVPSVESAARRVVSWGRAVRDVLAPASATLGARETANAIREGRSRQQLDTERAYYALRRLGRAFKDLPEGDRIDFMLRMERGGRQATPELQHVADALRKALDDRRDIIRQITKGKVLGKFNPDYFPHIWDRPGEAEKFFARLMGRRPIKGSQNFRHRRSFNDIQEGLDAGFKLKSDDPIQIALWKIRELDNFIFGQKLVDELKSRKIVKFVRDRYPPDGYAIIGDRAFEVAAPRDAEGAMRLRGYWVAPEPVARVINNHLGRGLRGSAFYDPIVYATNGMNQAQLGLSAFHLMMTSLDSIASKGALGVKRVLSGEWGGLADIAKTPLFIYAPIENMVRGSKVLREALDPGSVGGEMGRIVDALQAGGGRIRMDSFYRNSAVEGFWNALKGDRAKGRPSNPIGAILRFPYAVFEAAAYPIMEQFVPRMKLGVFADLASYELRRLGPNATRSEVREAMRKAWDSVDNRMGQLVYDNLFWNRALKDIGLVMTRSLGWNLGTVRELGGGLTDTARQIGRLATGRARDAEVTHRMAYTLVMPAVVAFYGGLLHYMMTGKRPEDLKDLFAPQTGGIRPDGKPERVVLASYMKDVYAYGTHPMTTVSHKLNPLWSAGWDLMVSNKDFYEREIRNPDDPLVKQMAEAGQFVASQFVPFSIMNMLQRRSAGESWPSSIQSFGGIVPAPAAIGRSKMEQFILDHQRREAGAVSREEFARRQQKSELAGDISRAKLKGDAAAKAAALDEVRSLVRSGELTRREASNVVKKGVGNRTVLSFVRLDAKDALEAWALGDASEQKTLRPFAQVKVERWIREHGGARDGTVGAKLRDRAVELGLLKGRVEAKAAAGGGI